MAKGLGSVTEGGTGVYLTVAGGFVWNRKKGEDDPDYAEQTYPRKDGTKGVRKGAKYKHLRGKIVNVYFKTHDEYGENINVVVDVEGERYILSVGTNNRYSQDLMKFLLKGELEQEFFMKPYDFIGKDKKPAKGITFKQDGEKIALRNDDAPFKDKDWWAEASKKQVKRYFEDLTEWFVAEVEEKVCSQFSDDLPELEKKAEAEETKVQQEEKAPKRAPESEEAMETTEVEALKERTTEVETPKVTPMKMRRAIKAYIEENYEGKELPKLDVETLQVWYNLVQKDEELPFKSEDSAAEVNQDNLDSQLDALIKK